MEAAYARALDAGVKELNLALDQKRTGESLLEGGNHQGAQSAFQAATLGFESEILAQLEARTVRARDAALAVRRSSASSGAARLERFSAANDRFDESIRLLTLGRFAEVYEGFRTAQSGFDQAALEWAAT